MEEIKFKGPFHSSQLDLLNSELDKPGLYIWGFMLDCDIKTVDFNKNVDFDFNKMKFIPYYVGIASGKSNMFIRNRLLTHRKLDEGVGLKYTRITLEGILCSYKNIDRCISNLITNKSNINKISLLDNITYFNNEDVLKQLHPDITINGKKGNHPINIQIIKGKKINDPLIENITKGGFWFLYCDINSGNIFDADKFKQKLEVIESWTFYKLKGITISKVMNYKTLIKKTALYNFKISSKIKIFKAEDEKSKGLQDTDFNGSLY